MSRARRAETKCYRRARGARSLESPIRRVVVRWRRQAFVLRPPVTSCSLKRGRVRWGVPRCVLSRRWRTKLLGSDDGGLCRDHSGSFEFALAFGSTPYSAIQLLDCAARARAYGACCVRAGAAFILQFLRGIVLSLALRFRVPSCLIMRAFSFSHGQKGRRARKGDVSRLSNATEWERRVATTTYPQALRAYKL